MNYSAASWSATETTIRYEHKLWADLSQQKLQKDWTFMNHKIKNLPSEWNPVMGT